MATGFSTNCPSVINHDILYDCSTLDVKGFATEGVIVKRNDIDFPSFTSVAETSQDVNNFPMKSGTKGYKIQQPNVDPFNGSQIEMNAGTYYNTFNKTIQFVMMADSWSDYNAQGLANGEYVIILRKKRIATNAAPAVYDYLIFGLDCGLKVTEMVKDYYSDDAHGAWVVTMVEEGAPVPVRKLFSTTPGGQETILESLLEEAE